MELLKELQKSTQLGKLGICKLRSKDGRSLCECTDKMKHPESQVVIATKWRLEHGYRIHMISPTCSSMPFFWWPIEEVAGMDQKAWKSSPITNCLDESPVKCLQNLHNIVDLEIEYGAYNGEQLHFEKGVFSDLKTLNIRSLTGLHSLVIEQEAFPNLKVLSMIPSQQLEEVPSGIQYLKKLKLLRVYKQHASRKKTTLFDHSTRTTDSHRL